MIKEDLNRTAPVPVLGTAPERRPARVEGIVGDLDADGTHAELTRARTHLRPGWAAELKWDGFRALLSVDAGKVMPRSRRDTEMGPAFPETVAGAVQLPDATTLDGDM
ncbi:hypothetical protein CEB94_00950 [Streptomyces hawaiiensis]|uniref:ATP-dependent DNA ligase n=1 Tax=Streptomyces hawaiiensis TaxID=67305 RepID=A0A6G5R6G5_9ACTN|nr:hypothetical protein CEB94_00950 [Streptomyces hawaiiensis]